MKKLLTNLNFQVILGILLGVVVGLCFKSFGPTAYIISQTFIKLITLLIPFIIFFTIVLGIANMSDIKKVGRVGGKALLYFEIVSTFALIIGVIVANVLKPGEGFVSKIAADSAKLAVYQKAAAEMHWSDFLAHIVPGNVFDAFTKGDILQILFFAILFGFGLSRIGETGKPVISLFEKLSQVFFNIMRMVMRVAPIGAFGGMAYTISTYGIKTLQPLAMLMGSVYLTSIFFIFGVLNLICYLYKFSLWNYLKFIREEILIVFGTSSSESVLPAMMEKMEKFGCSRSVVGLVIPAGYSFNLDGTTIYLSMSVIFLAQVFHIPLTLMQQVTIIGILMITSKGAAGVTGSGFIILTSTLAAIKIIPAEGVAILLGVDRFMSEARAITNMIGNGIATIVIAKSEGEFHQPGVAPSKSPPVGETF
jgi:aerobic C4-dicarboxylate transport protein